MIFCKRYHAYLFDHYHNNKSISIFSYKRSNLNVKNIISLFLSIVIIYIIKKFLNYKPKFSALLENLKYYRFGASISVFIYCTINLLIYIISAISIILYLCIKGSNNPLALTAIDNKIYIFDLKPNFLICTYNCIIFGLIFYVIILIMKLIKNIINIEITKMHFFLLSFEKYETYHTFFRDYLTLEALFLSRLNHFFYVLVSIRVLIRDFITMICSHLQIKRIKNFIGPQKKKIRLILLLINIIIFSILYLLYLKRDISFRALYSMKWNSFYSKEKQNWYYLLSMLSSLLYKNNFKVL